jgi:hypothetical protein
MPYFRADQIVNRYLGDKRNIPSNKLVSRKGPKWLIAKLISKPSSVSL